MGGGDPEHLLENAEGEMIPSAQAISGTRVLE